MAASNTTLGKKILLLRKEGLSYGQIAKAVPCSKSTVCYYVSVGASELKKASQRAYKRTKVGVLAKKVNLFKSRVYEPIASRKNREVVKRPAREQIRMKMKLFRRRSRSSSYSKVNNITKPYGIKEVVKKLGANPRCYLTGSQIDLSKPQTYSMDHVTPISKGGTNDLDNMELATQSANMAKNDLTVTQFVSLCKRVLMHHGYHVKKIDKEQKKKRCN